MEKSAIKGLIASVAIAIAAAAVGPALAQSAWCASNFSPWPGGIWDPETCYYLKPNSDGSIDVNASITPSGTQDVNLTQVGGATVAQGHGTAAAAVRVELPTDGTGIIAGITNPVTVSTHAVTQSGTWTVQPGNTANTTPWLVSLQPTTTGGSSVYTGSLTNTAVAVNASGGQMYGYAFYNPNATVCYIQFWNTAQGSVTVGTTAPVLSIGIPANGGANIAFPNGIAFGTALTIAATTTRANSTACSSNIDANVIYK